MIFYLHSSTKQQTFIINLKLLCFLVHFKVSYLYHSILYHSLLSSNKQQIFYNNLKYFINYLLLFCTYVLLDSLNLTTLVIESTVFIYFPY
jgi:hypothetical protein